MNVEIIAQSGKRCMFNHFVEIEDTLIQSYIIDSRKAVLLRHDHYGNISFHLQQAAGGRIFDKGSV